MELVLSPLWLLSKFGYNVTAVTGKMDKSDSLKKLGASSIIDKKGDLRESLNF